jgi:hypothetical protein
LTGGVRFAALVALAALALPACASGASLPNPPPRSPGSLDGAQAIANGDKSDEEKFGKSQLSLPASS